MVGQSVSVIIDAPVTKPPIDQHWLLDRGNISLAAGLLPGILGIEARLSSLRLATFCNCWQEPCSTRGVGLMNSLRVAACAQRGDVVLKRGNKM